MNGVSVKGLVVTRRGFPALADAHFSLPSHHFALVTGANGSGKTTLLRALSGLAETERGSIDISFGKESLTSSHRRLLRRHVAYVGHNPLYMSHATVHEHLSLCADFDRYHKEFSLTENEALIAARLEDRKNVRVEHLSAGQQRRLHFVSALVRSVDIICVDEPHASLDDESKQLIDTLFHDQFEKGRSFIVATHDPQRLTHLATETIELINGCAKLKAQA